MYIILPKDAAKIYNVNLINFANKKYNSELEAMKEINKIKPLYPDVEFDIWKKA